MSFNYTPAQWDQQSQNNILWDGDNSSLQSFIDTRGRRCRVVCETSPRNNLQKFARRIIGQNINAARIIYPNIRVVIENGRQLPTTQDYQADRINVETRNNIIIRVVNFG